MLLSWHQFIFSPLSMRKINATPLDKVLDLALNLAPNDCARSRTWFEPHKGCGNNYSIDHTIPYHTMTYPRSDNFVSLHKVTKRMSEGVRVSLSLPSLSLTQLLAELDSPLHIPQLHVHFYHRIAAAILLRWVVPVLVVRSQGTLDAV
eukprot:TRINITY_DN20137_c0_g1::TRINITY_DN20137_c0_g1_i1::g.30344::m.30344 TRINITY_DN20137_c0_g1::TRINITY_DN20137_c0_g1_i1::g.30344  ORF type:complete len:148 (-),score=-5.56,DUF2405/PF10293.4/0.061,HNH_4/PF13395.1/0.18 TRINITY_DN20137_c0_g1_i1:157-600(-)